MSDALPEDAITKSIVVRCGKDIAFRVWTEQVTDWWPKGHALSKNANTEVILEGRVGGRFYERAPDGVEHDWGVVTAWDPPHGLAFTWYRGSTLEQPTQVAVRFTALGPTLTRVDVEHRGPELIGALWTRNSPGYNAAWEELLPCYAAACPNLEI